MRLPAILLALAALGCGSKSSQQASQPQQIGGLIPLPGTHRVGPSPRPQSWPGIHITALPGNHVAAVWSQAILEAEVRDDFFQPVMGAQVRFYAVDGRLGPYGLGTSSTDQFGRAKVAAIPFQPGPCFVEAVADSGHSISNVCTFTVQGQ